MYATLIYFSQTGNTRRVAEAMGETFDKIGHAVNVLPLERATPEDIYSCDLLGIGTPCFNSRSPTLVRQFLWTLPSMENTKAFVFSTCGGAPGRVLYEMANILQRKSAQVMGGILVRGEVHHPVSSFVGRFSGRPNREDLAEVRSFIHALTAHIASNRPGRLPVGNPDRLTAGKGFYDLLALFNTDSVIRLLMPKPTLRIEACDRCVSCIESCPMKNIHLNPDPILGDDCIRCYRCSTGCPHGAFQVKWNLGSRLAEAMYGTHFVRWFGDMKPNEQIY